MMRAKLQINSVTETTNDKDEVTQVEIRMIPVSTKPFDKDGNSEDNSFARWTPSGSVQLTITNPVFFGRFKVGQKFYADFTEAVQ